MSPAIVFIQLGPVIPRHVGLALFQARLFNDCPIYLVGDAAALARFDVEAKSSVICVAREELPVAASHQAFQAHAHLDKSYRTGFWTYVVERFFVLESLMRERALSDVVHLEGDVLIYDDLRRLAPLLTRFYEGIAVPFDHDFRAVAGLMYIKSAEAIAAFTAFIAEFFAASPESGINDMQLLGLFRKAFGRARIDSLPVIPDTYAPPLRNLFGEESREPALFSNHTRDLGGLFDANALGQYIDGIDPRNMPGRNTVGFINETAMHQFSRYRFAIDTDAANRQIPVLLDGAETWPILSLHVHSKNLERFLSRPNRQPRPVAPASGVTDPRAIPGGEIITSERLQALADLTLTDRHGFDSHVGLANMPEIRTLLLAGDRARLVVSDPFEIEQLQAGEVLFTHTHLLDAFIRDVFSRMTRPFVLITHSSDHKVTEKFTSFLDDPRLLHWFAQNTEITHPKLTPLPIGLANRQWSHGDVEALETVMRRATTKTPTVYVNINPRTNPTHRGKVLDALKDKSFTHIGEQRPYRAYLEELAGARFCCSPEGNGTDCHRTWEALYVGSIPLVDRAAWLAAFADLPIVPVDDWQAVDAAFLDTAWAQISERRYDYRKLTMTYWRSAVLSANRRGF